jgi:hypothetical protein
VHSSGVAKYSIDLTLGATRYHFTVINPNHQTRGMASAQLDGAPVNQRAIPLNDDGGDHDVTIVLSPAHADRTFAAS